MSAKDSLQRDGALQVRRIATYLEVVDSAAVGANPVRKAWAAAVVLNPFAGGGVWNPELFVALGEQLGEKLGRCALQALACAPEGCSTYGKGAIVGTASEIEHGAAILHPKLGKPLRALLGRGKAIIPSTVKHGAPGAHIDVPLHGIDDEWNFALLDSIEVFVPGAPRYDEILVAVALGSGGRPFAR